MTSLQLFLPHETKPHVPIEWGTGKPVTEKLDTSLPRSATWRTTGEPTTQYYQLTQLRLSNIRDNDELIPKPQSIDIGRESINLPFPAEHPYSSHMPRYAVFPKFDSTEDPKRGVAARSEWPISSEMPGNPVGVTYTEKIKGHPERHEYTECMAHSQRRALYWPGENFFDQPPKLHGARPQYYPTPPKQICPNLQDRSGADKGGPDLRLSARTANALRNVERAQWHTTYQMNYTGLGPSNAMELDNLEDKQERLLRTGIEDDSLRPRTLNTFDPSRPIDGRIPRNVRPLPIYQLPLTSGATTYDTQYTGKPSLTEREEQRLLYGAEYLNLPDISGDPGRDVTWKEMDASTHPGPCLDKVETAKAANMAPDIQPQSVPPDTPPPSSRSPTGPPPHPGQTFLVEAKKKQDEDIQQIEAQNRWQVLQAQTPHHDQMALRYKLHKLPAEDKPPTFYRHEGRYNEERAGLYKTSYDPHSLSWSMNAESEAGSELTNTLNSNIQSQFQVSLPAARLNEDVNCALKYSRTYSLAKPELSGDRRDGPEVIQTYNQLKGHQQQRLLPPPPHLASPRVQERELLQREATTMGTGYNVKKFLQENALHPLCRNDPTTLMSEQNQNLDRVRTQTFPRPPKKNVHFDPTVSVVPLQEDTTSTPTTMVQSQLLDMRDTTDPLAPPLSSEDRNPPPPRLITTTTTTTTTTTPILVNHDQDFYEQPAEGFAESAGMPAQPLRHSAPPTPEGRARHIRFAEDENNNAGGEDRSVEESARGRYRSFPKRCPGSSHGHGLLDTEYTDMYRGYLGNSVPPGGLKKTTLSTYQFPNFDLGYKNDARFLWEPGRGVPRPQTTLLKIQDSFSKTEARRKFHETFPEEAPLLKQNIISGRRHQFWGFNSSVVHGD